MNKLTWPEAYDLIIQAYFKDEIKPYEPRFCFCGTLCNNNGAWSKDTCRLSRRNDFGNYSGDEYTKMEEALFDHVERSRLPSADYETRLFNGMSAALDVLKEIHRSRGENVDEIPTPFTKRLLPV